MAALPYPAYKNVTHFSHRHVKYDDSLFFVSVLSKNHPYYQGMPTIKKWHKRCILKATARMRDLINWSETDEKSRHGLPVLRIRLQN